MQTCMQSGAQLRSEWLRREAQPSCARLHKVNGCRDADVSRHGCAARGQRPNSALRASSLSGCPACGFTCRVIA